MMRILVTRTDRLGDVILATPVLTLLREKFKDAQITFLVRKEWMPILQYGSEVELMEYLPEESSSDLAVRLRERRFNRAYVIRDEKNVSVAVWKAHIKERFGPFSSLRSWFLYNRGKRQNRAACFMHEAEYNLDLIEKRAPALNPVDLPRAFIKTTQESKFRAAHFLQQQSLTENRFFVIHPGSSGSARYVKIEKLYELAREILKSGMDVLISAGPGEGAILDEFKQQVPEVKSLGGENAIGLDGMAEVYRKAKAVIAHGTGPLHLAAAVGTPVLSIFPPIFVLSEKRWGPLADKRAVWVPDVPCPAKYKCHGEKCRYYDCMDLFEVNTAMKLLESITS